MLAKISLAIGILGVLLIVYGVKDAKLAKLVQPAPQSISCEALAQSGPGENHHILLEDFVFTDMFIYEEKNGMWRRAWVPVVPLEGVAHQAIMDALEQETPVGITMDVDFSVIVQLNDVSGIDDIELIEMQDTIQGVIVNEVRTIDRETKRLLRESYPSINTDRCWLLEAGRKIPTSQGGSRKIWFGVIALIAAVVSGYFGLRRS